MPEEVNESLKEMEGKVAEGLDVELEETNPPEEDAKKEEDSKNVPPEGSPRWNEIYWKAKEGERRLKENEELKKQLELNQKMIKEMQEHNKKLAENVEKVATTTVKAFEKDEQKDQLKVIENQIEKLKEKRREAIESSDFDSVEELMDEIFELKLQHKELKSKPKESEKEPKEKKGSTEDVNFDPAPYEQFVNDSPWFTEDPIMRAAAIEVDNILISDPKWSTKNDTERLLEVKKRVENRFGYKGKKNGGVEGDSKIVGGKKTVKLTQEEVKVAEGLGLTPQEYAKQKAYMEE